MLDKHLRWAAAFAVLVIVALALTLSLTKPIYEPTARVEVDPTGTEQFSLEGPMSRAEPIESWRLRRKTCKVTSLQLRSSEIAPRSGLTVSRDSGSRLITISFACHELALAAIITNAVVEQFIEISFRTRHNAILQSTGCRPTQ